MNEHYSNRDHLNIQRPLPNSTAVLVLGILSLVACQICGIIALVLANQDMKLYNDHPESYTESSLSHVKAGRICAIISVILLAVFILMFIALVAFNLSRAGYQR
ncbi:MAG: CCC motif membrane protein [Ferruginibacter sp.]